MRSSRQTRKCVQLRTQNEIRHSLSKIWERPFCAASRRNQTLPFLDEKKEDDMELDKWENDGLAKIAKTKKKCV